jgi:hypothetical protein
MQEKFPPQEGSSRRQGLQPTRNTSIIQARKTE